MEEWWRERLVKRTQRAFPAYVEPHCVLCLQDSLLIVLLQYGTTLALPQFMQKHAEPIRTNYMFKHTVFMTGHCMQRPAASTPALRLGCDMLAVAQRRLSFFFSFCTAAAAEVCN